MGAPIVVVAGASGVVGRHFLDRARDAGYDLRILTRGGARPGRIAEVHRWDPKAVITGDAAALDAVKCALEGADLVVNLAGASLAEGRLGRGHRERVLYSRIDATGALVRAHDACERPPACWIQASATGYYGETGEADVFEDSPRGRGFLAEVCERWEAGAAPVERRETRLIVARIGLVLAKDAPAWELMLAPILLGVGGPLGSGRQWWAWIDADDLADALLFLHGEPQARGAYNLTSADPVRQGDLVQQTAIAAGRPAMFPAPAFALRLALGGVADALLLPSCRALPRRLEAAGFRFQRPTVGREILHLFDAVDPNSP